MCGLFRAPKPPKIVATPAELKDRITPIPNPTLQRIGAIKADERARFEGRRLGLRQLGPLSNPFDIPR